MGLRTGQSRAQFTLLSWLSSTGGATNRQGLFQLCFHGHIMYRESTTRWSIVTSATEPAQSKPYLSPPSAYAEQPTLRMPPPRLGGCPENKAAAFLIAIVWLRTLALPQASGGRIDRVAYGFAGHEKLHSPVLLPASGVAVRGDWQSVAVTFGAD
jgi:hypothetical protein